MKSASYPRYLALYECGILQARVEEARKRLEVCTLCPRVCRANRLDGEIGQCNTGRFALVSSFGSHFGEESVLRGTRGSGTVFFAGCNSRRLYCQNYEISQLLDGSAVTAEQLAEIFLRVQRMGCHNLNLVTPSHVVAQMLEALEIAISQGFRLPLVYNTSAYDSVQSLKLLDGVVDIYMPDLKYSDSKIAEKYSGISHYWEVARVAFQKMQSQVGDLVVEDGLAKRGLLIRHLVLPSSLAGSQEALRFIAEKLSRDSWVNIMAQYHPAYKALDYPELSRRITSQEHGKVVEYARSLGLHRGIPFEFTN